MIAEMDTTTMGRVDGKGSRTAAVDRQPVEKAVRDLLLALGEDPDREGLQDTPRRVARMYRELF